MCAKKSIGKIPSWASLGSAAFYRGLAIDVVMDNPQKIQHINSYCASAIWRSQAFCIWNQQYHRSIFQQLKHLSVAYPLQHQHRLLQMQWKALLSEWIYAYLSISFFKIEHKHLVLVVTIILQLSWRSLQAIDNPIAPQ